MWLKDLLPSYIPSIRVFAFEYEIEGALSPISLRDLAQSLLDKMNEQRKPKSVGSHYCRVVDTANIDSGNAGKGVFDFCRP